MTIRTATIGDITFLVLGRRWMPMADCEFDVVSGDEMEVMIRTSSSEIILSGESADDFVRFLENEELGIKGDD